MKELLEELKWLADKKRTDYIIRATEYDADYLYGKLDGYKEIIELIENKLKKEEETEAEYWTRKMGEMF